MANKRFRITNVPQSMRATYECKRNTKNAQWKFICNCGGGGGDRCENLNLASDEKQNETNNSLEICRKMKCVCVVRCNELMKHSKYCFSYMCYAKRSRTRVWEVTTTTNARKKKTKKNEEEEEAMMYVRWLKTVRIWDARSQLCAQNAQTNARFI